MKIDELIEKYYEGETSVEEELLLKQFLENEVGTSPTKDIMSFVSENSGISLDDDFESRLFERIEKESKSKVSGKIESSSRWWTVAASIALLLGGIWIALLLSQPSQGIVITDDNLYENKDLALLEIQNAFGLISSTFETADENLKNLEQINQSYELLELLNMFGSSDK